MAETYIYFPSSDNLNDPLEGFRRTVWSGDQVVWQNLYKHYFLCLLKRSVIYLVDVDLNDDNFPIYASLEDFPPEILRFAQAGLEKFLACSNIIEHVDFLSRGQRVIEQDEIRWHVRSIHTYALKLVSEVLIAAGQLQPGQKIVDVDDEFALRTSTMVLEYVKHPGFLEDQAGQLVMRAGLAKIESQLLATAYAQWKTKKSANWGKLTSFFPDDYVRNLDRLCKINWYVACFMRTPYNSAIWGTYGNNHSAVCLKFRVGPCVDGFTIPLMSQVPRPETWLMLPLKKVKYDLKPPALPFFKSLVFYNEEQLRRDWYVDRSANVSSIASDVFEDQKRWRDNFWLEHNESVTTKLADWAGEDEYRILLQSTLGAFDDAKNRKLKYKFDSLEGIIFGIRTSELDKFRLIDIVQKLCNEFGRESFEFYQAYFDSATSKIAYRSVLTVTADIVTEVPKNA
ncbi:DUF2971 domain-containing protein [Pseudomonas putida]|uniref:DUF2971 domain-containing protein n=1 Tax=Pseudomonas putida TaxID=303 RepID=UPI00383B8824